MGPSSNDIYFILGFAAAAAVLFKAGMPKIGSLCAAATVFAVIAVLLRMLGYRI